MMKKKRYNPRQVKDYLKKNATELIGIFSDEFFIGFTGYKCEFCKRDVNINYEPNKKIWFCECGNANEFTGRNPEFKNPDYGPKRSELKLVDRITGTKTIIDYDYIEEDIDFFEVEEKITEKHKRINNYHGVIYDYTNKKIMVKGRVVSTGSNLLKTIKNPINNNSSSFIYNAHSQPIHKAFGIFGYTKIIKYISKYKNIERFKGKIKK